MTKEPLRYFLYARKSSESEDRQMASIEDQEKEVVKMASELGINIVGVFTEAKSAKKPGRKAFNEMLQKIEKGKADGIICWKLNRLARNPIDGGKVCWLLQQNTIKHIQCYGRDYKPTDNVLMMYVELGMANQFVNDLSVDIGRGVRAKAERGWYPTSRLPMGYIHNKNNKGKVLGEEIIPDPETFPELKKLWRLMATGSYSILEIMRKAKDNGLVNPMTKKPYTKNSFYRMFTREFYAGYFYWKGEDGELVRHKGKHKPMVSEMEFDKVQRLFGERTKCCRAKKYDYTYRGLLRCGDCGGNVTAERKLQVRCTSCRYKFSCLNKEQCPGCGLEICDMESPSFVDKVYYHCTKKNGNCKQGSMTEEELEEQYAKVLESISIPKQFFEFICEELKSFNDLDKQEDIIAIRKLEKRKTELISRCSSLSLMRADGEITKEEYVQMKEDTKRSIEGIEKEIRGLDYTHNNWYSIAGEYLNLSLLASKVMNQEDKKLKKNLLMRLGSNQDIFDKKLVIIKAKPLLEIQNCLLLYNTKKEWFEPENGVENKGQSGYFHTRYPIWRTALNDVRTSIVDGEAG